jgi:hypothetical protein
MTPGSVVAAASILLYRNEGAVRGAAAYVGRWDDADVFPAAAQLAIMLMAWNGSGTVTSGFPKMIGYLARRPPDFTMAATECEILADTGPPPVHAKVNDSLWYRNQYTKYLFAHAREPILDRQIRFTGRSDIENYCFLARNAKVKGGNPIPWERFTAAPTFNPSPTFLTERELSDIANSAVRTASGTAHDLSRD